MQSKKCSESKIVMSEMVFPNDTNFYGNLMGGRLMYWIDNISFESPIKLGQVVHIEAQVCRAFKTSMEIHVKVWGEDITQQYKYKSNEAYLTFVALDPNGKPRAVPESIPETDEEKKLFEGALRRRQLRLILAKKMKPEEAKELKALFVND
jgi:acyl-CoA hydrolase